MDKKRFNRKEVSLMIIVFVAILGVVGLLAFLGGKHSPSTGNATEDIEQKKEKWQEEVVDKIASEDMYVEANF